MTRKTWHPDDLKQVFPEIPEHISRAVMETAGSVKEENEMKRRFVFRRSLALALAVICIAGIALAVCQPQISAIFGKQYGTDFQEWMEQGDVAVPDHSVVVDGVTFTLQEAARRNRGLYGLRVITPGENMLLLCSDYSADEPYGYATFHGEAAPENAPSVLEKAAQENCAIKQVNIYLQKIGADGGAMLEPQGWGYDVRPLRDGSIQFLFEVEAGTAVPKDAKSYTVLLRADVYNVNPDGETLWEERTSKEWTVEIAPVPFAEVMETAPAEETALPETPVQPSALQPETVMAPDAYRESGTLPVYEAVPRNFQGKLDYAWFNESGVVKEEAYPRHIGGSVDFANGGHLDWHEKAIFYTVYDGTYEAVSEVFDGKSSTILTETLPRRSMAAHVSSIAGWMTYGFPGTERVYALESTVLTQITLEEAQEKAETLLGKLGMEGYTCTVALDMGLERIREMGDELNRQIDSGNLYTNDFRYDYQAATVADEGYYLQYHKFGSDGDLAGQFRATFYITAEGIQDISLNDSYERGAIIRTPEGLMDAAAVCEKLPEEMAASRVPETPVKISRATLTWMPLRAEKGTEMELCPVWMLTYVSNRGEREGYTGWAAFNALDGTLVDAVFN